MSAPLFTSAGGLPMALLPFAKDGTERTPNGQSVLSLEQATERFSSAEDSLRILYYATIEEFGVGEESAGTSDVAREAAQLEGLRRTTYPKLSREEFVQLIAFQRAKGLDPREKWAWPTKRYDPDRGQEVTAFYFTVRALRQLVIDAGDSFECEAPAFTMEDSRIPYRCTLKASRVSASGVRHSFTATAAYDEHFKRTEFWLNMPENQLAKCAEAKAIRALYPEFGDVYIEEEGKALDIPTKGTLREIDSHRGQPWPRTSMEFQTALFECGLTDAKVRNQVIATLRSELTSDTVVEDSDAADQAFFRAALERLYEDPDRYSAKIPRGKAV